MERKEYIVVEDVKTKELEIWETSEYESICRMIRDVGAKPPYRVVVSFNRHEATIQCNHCCKSILISESYDHYYFTKTCGYKYCSDQCVEEATRVWLSERYP